MRHSTEICNAEADDKTDLLINQALDNAEVLSEGRAVKFNNPFETVQSIPESEIALQEKVDSLQAKLQRSKLENSKERKHSAKLQIKNEELLARIE